jgi:hypothetical protein
LLQTKISGLPATARTLLRTGEAKACSRLSGGDYMYFGVRQGIERILCSLSDNELSNITEIQLAFNIDGLPLFSSSAYSLWPVLCYAVNISAKTVFVVALYGGTSKPSDLNFIQDTVDELQSLLLVGFNIRGSSFSCVLKMCVCDAPARAMVKATKLYSGYFGCDKCSQQGKYVGRMTYLIVLQN